MAEKDKGGKYLIEYDSDGWVQWLLDDPTVRVVELLSAEFQFIGRRGDSLLKVVRAGIEFLILVELQLQYDPTMPARVQNYSAMGRQKYKLPILAIVVYLTPPPKSTMIPTAFHEEFMGMVTHQDFKVIKMWELSATQFNTYPISVLPYVPFMEDVDATIIQQCVQRIRTQPDYEEIETILALFAKIALDDATIDRILRWNMVVLEKSAFYQEILARGVEQGIEQERVKQLLKIMKHRLNHQNEQWQSRLERLPLNTLDELVEVAWGADSVAEFEGVLSEIEDSLFELNNG